MSLICKCGRVGEHCPNADCGSKNKWPMIRRSEIVSRQLNRDVRFYRCRKCGTEYGYLGNTLFDAECNAPEETRLKQKQIEPEDEVRAIKEAIALLESKGLKVSMNDTAAIVAPVPEPTQDIIEEQVTSPAFSLDDLFKKKEPSKDENNP